MLRAATLAFALSGAPVLACSPALIEPSAVPIQGPGCAYVIHLNEIDAVHLGEAVRAPGGLILQALSEGNGCYARFHLIAHDCAAAQVMVIGAENFSLMEAMGRDPSWRPGIELIREDALAAPGGTLADLRAASLAEGYGEPQVLRPADSLRFGAQTLPLACACREAGGS